MKGFCGETIHGKIKKVSLYLFTKEGWSFRMNLALILSGIVLILDTLIILSRSNINMGVLMPAILGLPLLTLGLFYEKAKIWMNHGFGAWVKYCFLIGYAAFLLIVSVCSVLIVRAAREEVPKNADAVIVLGAAVHGTKPSLALQNRLNLAADYLRENENCIAILSGGMGPQEKIAEAEAMRVYLLEQGISEERIVMEKEARSTYENFLYSRKILEERFPEGYTAIFATNDFHIFRGKIAAERAGLGKIQGLGCSSPAYIVPNYYIRESLAIFRYALLGLR